jgi:hypothetical protein
MRPQFKLAAKLTGLAALLLVIAGLIAPYLRADQFGLNIKWSLERALGRRVDIGTVRFSLFRGPGFQVEKVVIYEDPAIGIEPVARVEMLSVAPRLLSLIAGHLVVSSIRLEDASINLVKTSAPSDPGRWNFERLLNRSVIAAFPGIRVRNGRINFKFGDTKSVFYLINTDLDISPGSSGNDWKIDCTAEPARTDRPAQGLGSFTAKGRWSAAPGADRLDLDVRLERTGLGEITALLRGQNAGVHGTVSSKLRLAGPLDNVQITGRMDIEDVHRWDLLPSKGENWPLDLHGRLNLATQQLELESNSARSVPLPLHVRLRVGNYLSQPRWGVSVNWNQFPVEPLMDLARHMGVELPPKLNLKGSIDGAIGYSDAGSFQGEMAFHNTVLTIPDSPPVRFEQAALMFGQGHAYLKPAVVRVGEQDQAQVEADFEMGTGALDLEISTTGMNVASLRAQVALAAVPWLEQVQSGNWSGQLHYRLDPAAQSGWTGKLTLTDAVIPIQGVESPVQLSSARALIDHARVSIDRIDAQVGETAISGEYRYEPNTARPHRIRLVVGELSGTELERQLAPVLLRGSSLLQRALGRIPVPDWLRNRGVEGTVEAGSILIGGERFENVRARLVWDATRIAVDRLRAKLDKAVLTGGLTINLRGRAPVYAAQAQLKGLPWQRGKVDLEGTLSSRGAGAQLLAGLSAEGLFHGKALEFGGQEWETAAGGFQVSMSRTGPKLRFTELQLATEDEAYTGQGATQDDGRLLIVLNSGAKQMRMSGSLAKLQIDPPRP